MYIRYYQNWLAINQRQKVLDVIKKNKGYSSSKKVIISQL